MRLSSSIVSSRRIWVRHFMTTAIQRSWNRATFTRIRDSTLSARSLAELGHDLASSPLCHDERERVLAYVEVRLGFDAKLASPCVLEIFKVSPHPIVPTVGVPPGVVISEWNSTCRSPSATNASTSPAFTSLWRGDGARCSAQACTCYSDNPSALSASAGSA